MNYLERFRTIHTFVFDIDGVFTDGMAQLMPDGTLIRSFSIRDGFAIRTAINKGYHVIIISGGTTPGVQNRLGYLGVTDIFTGVEDKEKQLVEICRKKSIDLNGVLYMGDDIPDLKAMQIVALPCCPSDAVDEVRDLSLYISHKKGGGGCVRDVIEKVLKLKGEWPGYPY